MFITFEGIEGVGKSTLQRALAAELIQAGHEVLVTREPGGTPFGEKLRDAILSPDHEATLPVTELLVMFAARAQHVKECIEPALRAGKIVLCDRFTDTTRAYQCGGRRLPNTWVDALVEMTHPKLSPDLTFWLDLPVEAALARAKNRSASDRIEKETKDFFERAREVYLALAEKSPQTFIRLEASLSPEALVQAAKKFLNDQLARART